MDSSGNIGWYRESPPLDCSWGTSRLSAPNLKPLRFLVGGTSPLGREST